MGRLAASSTAHSCTRPDASPNPMHPRHNLDTSNPDDPKRVYSMWAIVAWSRNDSDSGRDPTARIVVVSATTVEGSPSISPCRRPQRR